MELTTEQIEAIRKDNDGVNFKEHVARIRRLLDYAKPLNWASKLLYQDYGFDDDRRAEDFGGIPE